MCEVSEIESTDFRANRDTTAVQMSKSEKQVVNASGETIVTNPAEVTTNSASQGGFNYHIVGAHVYSENPHF